MGKRLRSLSWLLAAVGGVGAGLSPRLALAHGASTGLGDALLDNLVLIAMLALPALVVGVLWWTGRERPSADGDLMALEESAVWDDVERPGEDAPSAPPAEGLSDQAKRRS